MLNKGRSNKRNYKDGGMALTKNHSFINGSFVKSPQELKNDVMGNNQVFIKHQLDELDTALKEKRYPIALRLCENLLKFGLDNQHVHYQMGLILYNMGKHKSAAEEFFKTVDIDPLYEKAWNNLGSIFYENGDFEKAIEMLDIAIDINPSYEMALLNRAYALCNLGEYKRSRSELEAILKMHSDCKEARVLLQKLDEKVLFKK